MVSSHSDYSIAAVSKLTGVSCHSLRVWERRYGFPVPGRLPSGHRRYSQEQVATLRDLASRVRRGQPIGELLAGYRAGPLPAQPASIDRPEILPTALVLCELLLAGDLSAAGRLLDRCQDQMSCLEMTEGLIAPALVEVGERGFRQETALYQRHLAYTCLLGWLHRLLDQARQANPTPRRRILVGSVAGDRHEGGFLMVAIGLELAGWRAIPLGADLPVAEVAAAVDAWKPDAVALSFVLARSINKRFAELGRIRSVPIFVGGRSIVNHQRLARGFGLWPLIGTLSAAVSQLVIDTEHWYHGPPSDRSPHGFPRERWGEPNAN